MSSSCHLMLAYLRPLLMHVVYLSSALLPQVLIFSPFTPAFKLCSYPPQSGNYALERLVEMIGLHLEATYPDYNTWSEFASCLLKLSQCGKDRTSMFRRGKSSKTWKLRSIWWLNRHFSKDILASDMSTGDLQLITYKAACASHLYGKEFEYLTKVNTCLNEHDDQTLLTILHLHIQNSIGFCSRFLGNECRL